MRKRRSNVSKIPLLIIVLFGIIGILQYSYGWSNENNNFQDNQIKQEENNREINNYQDQSLTVHYLDVGQGDSILIELPNKELMLIDGAEAKESDKIINYIKKEEYSKIDYVIATHPHADHIGGLANIIGSFEIESVYMPKAVSTSKTYENLLKTIANKGLKVKSAKAGVKIIDEENYKVEMIAPNKDSYKNLNNYSVVLKITYGNRELLFMGDAEEESEKEITADVKSDVIKIGHHGSNTSSSIDFVRRVNPEYAIISVGENNKYNHPNLEIINRWQSLGATIFRTDINGTIIVTTDGKELQITSEK